MREDNHLVAQRLKDQISNLDFITQAHYEHLSTIFYAIEKMAPLDPNLTAALAKVGHYVADALSDELDALGVHMDHTSKEVH